MTPLGKKSAASFPRSAATRSSRRCIVGSPSRSSSPTSAAAIAARMPGVGLVTVSLLRSIVVRVMRGNMAGATFPALSSPSRLLYGRHLDDFLLGPGDGGLFDDHRLFLR